jgi:hypothetical protein
MKAPIINFTMDEAMDHYKNNPAVKCLADDKVMMLNSAIIQKNIRNILNIGFGEKISADKISCFMHHQNFYLNS